MPARRRSARTARAPSAARRAEEPRRDTIPLTNCRFVRPFDEFVHPARARRNLHGNPATSPRRCRRPEVILSSGRCACRRQITSVVEFAVFARTRPVYADERLRLGHQSRFRTRSYRF